MTLKLSYQLLPLLFLLSALCVTAIYPKTPRFGLVSKFSTNDYGVQLPPEFVTYYYTQTLDHFNYKPESYATFQQRYIVNSKYWGGANSSSPIFVYTGDEGDITLVADFAGAIVELASRFKGLLVYIEHRYYGESNPFGSQNEAFSNASTLGFFSSTQALADFAQVIIDLKGNLSAENCPVIAVGGSYGGMLASWFRLKYPHIAYGAFASSAPILYFDNISPQDGYSVIVTKDFRDTSESCYNTIRQSWGEIDKVAAQPNGLWNLSRIFSTCQPLNSSEDLKDYLVLMYMVSAQYDNPPYNPVEKVCSAIDGAMNETDILSRVAAGLNVSAGEPCHQVFDLKLYKSSGWDWQTCTEMVMPIGNGANDTMFEALPFDLNNFTRNCEGVFGVTPRPHWITTEFGGQDIKSVLGNFASNIIFSNGLRDPYSAGGVLQNISDSVVAVYTEEGAHCLDLATPTATDPDWLVSQREAEVKIIEGWLATRSSLIT
ncbi:unnamed protein product [Ilex paraguariensis]|uniref:Lysosomal Pro-X carboxypeptidase n=1 Tax=Ilex paraguariensis TaxID=185542 RepID=A0ABC8V1K0_9AQUA